MAKCMLPNTPFIVINYLFYPWLKSNCSFWNSPNTHTLQHHSHSYTKNNPNCRLPIFGFSIRESALKLPSCQATFCPSSSSFRHLALSLSPAALPFLLAHTDTLSASDRAYQGFPRPRRITVRASGEWAAAGHLIGYPLTNRISPTPLARRMHLFTRYERTWLSCML